MKKSQKAAGSAIFVIFFFSIIIIISSQICSPSQYFNGQRCAPCKANCICNSQNTCFDCLPGYAFDATFSNCLQCPQSTDLINIGCSQCCSQISGTSFVCSSCSNQPYVFLRGGQCLKLNGCLSLTINGLCNSCQGGYYLFEGTCYPCDSSCSTCYDSSLCLTCNQGFYNKTDINNAFCQACPVGCQSCSSATTCSSCLAGYRFSTPNCISCGNVNCLSCTLAGCTLCASGTTLISGVCYLCTDVSKQGTVGCLTCSTTLGNMIQCNSCADTYYLNSGACSLCSSHFPHSSLCNSTTVFQCLDDYHPIYTNRFYLLNNLCIANSKSCKIMKNSNGDCSSCYFQGPDNYYKLNGVQCTKCVLAGCASFSTSCQCLSCQNGYRFINSLCSACQNLHCNKCQSDVQSCQACDTGYGLISSACILCVKSNCNNCDGDYTQCSICDNGYYLNSGNCYQCQTNCVTCTSSTLCSLCNVGYYLQTNGRCQLLPLNCLQVDPNYLSLNVAVCKKCAYGYQVIDGNCYPCSQSLYNLGDCQKYCPNYYALLKFQIQSKYSLIFVFLTIVYLTLL